ncbi:alpha/beta-hydrolase [Mycena vulgaris]|nr:alpha/beta-hydrolase [Mycena vulgaris]
MRLEISPLVFICPQNVESAPGKFLKMAAKRYSTPESISNIEGFTLILMHGIGANKEQWEPTIEEIFRLQNTKAPHLRVREAWSLDRQNHGDAALLNREELELSRRCGVSGYEWAEGISAFVRSPIMQGKRIVGISHSSASIALVGSTRTKNMFTNSYAALILFEPTMVAADLYHPYVEKIITDLPISIRKRRDKWPSRENAHQWLKARYPWNTWDARVLQTFVDHGLVETSDGGVALKCDKYQEANCCPDTYAHFDSVAQISRVCRTLPIHIVWGTKEGLIPEIARPSVSDRSQGRLVASVTRLTGTHMLLQENPDGIAERVCELLDTISVVPVMQGFSRL